MKAVVVQPWFDAPGHPAQSLLNTARALGRRDDVAYLVGCEAEDDPRLAELRRAAGPVAHFAHRGHSIRTGTWRALRSVLAMHRARILPPRVFFFDGHLALLALLWGILRRGAPLEWLGLLYLAGPERIAGRAILEGCMRRLLGYPEFHLLLRTEELAQAWRARYPQARAGAIGVLPSLEIPERDVTAPAPVPGAELRLGVLGQVRRGKALEWLVPAYARPDARGRLTVAGAFSDARARRELGFLLAYPHFREGMLPEAALLEAAGSQDYLLLLYDDWDDRMEAATLYLAARVGRPVACHPGGWLERKVLETGCGVVVPREREAALAALAALPRPGEDAYARLRAGMARFRERHASAALRGRYLEVLLGEG